MSASKFKFVSPGIFISEVDQSQTPRLPGAVGPVIIGRSEKGPGMRPVRIQSFSDFVEVFGTPIPGGTAIDVSRNGNYTAPTYAAYAAQAYLRNSNPITFVRLLGTDHANATGTLAGWNIANPGTLATQNSGAYGLFLLKPGAAADYTHANGQACLAAVIYSSDVNRRIVPAGLNVTGTGFVDGENGGTSSITLPIKSTAGGNFELVLRDEVAGTVIKRFKVNFDRTSGNYIRKVLNTNPTLTNSTITPAADLESYWLGATYERAVETLGLDATAGERALIVLPLADPVSGAEFNQEATESETGWVFSQFTGATTDTSNSSTTGLANLRGDTGLSATKLFRFRGLHAGEWQNKNIKMSIQDIKESTNEYDKFGTFTLVIRAASDTDSSPVILERFSGLNLNPTSPDYIVRRIGDMKSTWDSNERRYIEHGEYMNQSRFVRVEVSSDVANGNADALLPMGFYGPVKFRDMSYDSVSAPQALQDYDTTASGGSVNGVAYNHTGWSTGAATGLYQGHTSAAELRHVNTMIARVVIPSHPLRAGAADSKLRDPSDAYFGIETHYSSSNRQAEDYGDLNAMLPNGVGISNATTEHSFIFTLQDIVPPATADLEATYSAGSYAANTSFDSLAVTPAVVTAKYGTTTGSPFSVLDAGHDRFTMPIFGGWDGLDARESDPFRNSLLSGKTETSHYAYNSVRRAIDSVADEEVVECNLMAVPGLTEPTLTEHMINACERRGDALAIIDLEDDYTPLHESSLDADDAGRNPNVTSAVASLKARSINSSYGAAYFPFVKVRDNSSGRTIDCPPSVVALGTMGSSARKTELWFAPAGFTRGGLSTGSAGLPVTGVRLRLTSKERDKLYEHGINPIASFPSEGIVIFGQKTLQATPSALNRINVRRLMIFLKTEVSRMAATVLFDQNVQTTWTRFRSKVEPFLASVKTRFGLTEYRLVLDETTTTPELVDRNVMYAKILLKPARAIEYIAIDFVITDSGASFSE